MKERQYFGTDGIRDVANQGRLTPDMVVRIAHAVGYVTRERCGDTERRPRICLVRDTRVSGPMIAHLLTGTLLGHGVDVYDAGVLPTPACALLVRRREFDLGIVVSASHNPMPDNGIKLFGPDGRKLGDEAELAVEHWIEHQGARDVDVTGADVGRSVDFTEGASIYLEAMTQEFFATLDLSGLRIVLDAANGAGSRVAPRILAALGADVEAIGCDPTGLDINDGTGPYHTDRAVAAVRETGADLGIVLDGDADRVILVDETGEVQDGDSILGLLAGRADVPRLVVTVMSNLGLHVLCRETGVELHQTPVGDRYVSERMEEVQAPFGGEQSGHVIFRTPEGWFGDGLYTGLRVLEILRAEDASLSELMRRLERFPQVLVNVEVREKPPFSEIAVVEEALARHRATLGEEGRILLRYSGTEMLARVMVEGRERSEIDAIATDLADVVRRAIG